MKKLSFIFTVLALCLFVSVSAFAQEQKAVIEIPKEAKVGATISVSDATATESAAAAPQMTISAEEETTKKEAANKKNKQGPVVAAGSKKTFTIYASMYCESKGGDDGSRLEPYGYIQVLPISTAGTVVAPPNAPGSSLLFNRAINDFIYLTPGQTRYINKVSYTLDVTQNTRLLLRGSLADDDQNSDDGYVPNASDQMGSRYQYVYLSTILNNGNYGIFNHRYADGNQIIWVKYTIYAQ